MNEGWKPTVTHTGPTLFTSWPGILRKSDRVAEPGIRFVRHTTLNAFSIEVLEYRDREGLLRGTAIWEPRGCLSITVDPAFQRQGIATKLIEEAVKRWPIDFVKQGYTEDGAAFVRKFLETGKAAGAR
jgi:GNAT superfamily N-acetyltransferase